MRGRRATVRAAPARDLVRAWQVGGHGQVDASRSGVAHLGRELDRMREAVEREA